MIKQTIKLIINTLISTIKTFIKSDFALFNKLNEQTDNSLYILGNSSSLNNELTELDNNNDYMVLNRHVKHESYTKIKPKYYVIADPYFFINKEGINVLKEIESTTNWEMILFLPNYRIAKNHSIKNKYIKVQLYNTTPFNGYTKLKHYLYRHNICMPIAQNVMVACLYIGICLGYKNIKIFGVEHSWTKNLYVRDDNKVYQIDPHFYDKTKVSPRLMKTYDNKPYKLHEILRDYAQMFASYWEIKEFAQTLNVKITNMTKDSFIDAFERYK